MSYRIAAYALALATVGALSVAQPAAAQGIADDGSIAGGVNALYWTREDPQTVPVAIPGLDVANADMGWEPGAEFWVNVGGTDARYMWINSFDGSTGIIAGGIAVDVSLETDLQGAEINRLVRVNENVSLLGGFRWIGLDEFVTQSASAGGVTIAQTDDVENDLYGGQVGGSARLWSAANAEIDFVGKVGLYSNQGSATTRFFLGAPVNGPSDQNAQLAWTTDARLGGSLWLTENIVANGGYQVLYLDGITRGETVGAYGSVGDYSDSLVFHGAYFGLSFYR